MATQHLDSLPIYERFPLPTPFPVGRINSYLLPSSPACLIDAGVRSERSFDELERRLAERGMELGSLEMLLVTHLHNDHAGAAPEIARRTSIPVLCHEESLLVPSRTRAAFLSLMGRYGASQKVLDELELAWALTDQLGEPLSQAPEVRRVADGEVVIAGGLELEVLYTPGHAPGHLCFVAREEGLIFCGDLLLAQITSNPLPHFDETAPRGRRVSLELYLASLTRVEALGPLLGLPGHGPSLPDSASAARHARRHILSRNKKVLRLIRSYPGQSLFELAGRFFFQEDSVLGQTLAFCELLAHADLLEERGAVMVDPTCGVPELLDDR